eukprot:2202322-Pleurochrysis_carterae.AAC.1
MAGLQGFSCRHMPLMSHKAVCCQVLECTVGDCQLCPLAALVILLGIKQSASKAEPELGAPDATNGKPDDGREAIGRRGQRAASRQWPMIINQASRSCDLYITHQSNYPALAK